MNMPAATNLARFWAKSSKDDESAWHPLLLHLLDIGAVADAILAREPESTRKRIAEILGFNWEDARPWILLLISAHDLGKACPGFQCKWKNMTALTSGRSPNTQINHAFVSQISLSAILQRSGWPVDLAELVADAVGCHHGSRASTTTIDQLTGDIGALGSDDWTNARKNLFQLLFEVFEPTCVPIKPSLSGPDFMLLAGLTSFADWIGSNESWFPFGTPLDCEDPKGWFIQRRARAEEALGVIGWEARDPLADRPKTFEQVFNFAPRPLQVAVAKVLDDLRSPAILLVEAPMGEGKTEAAFFSHLELQRRFNHRGLYIALPTKATGNAMFQRTLKFLSGQGKNRKIDFQLLHGGKLLNETFENLRLSGVFDSETGGEIRASEWFTSKKRALLSDYGVGTIDQALLPILPVRHNFVRLWGLANRVVVFDEIHAYDTYTGTLLVHLLRWLLAMGSSVVLLSATLSPSIRRKLADAVGAALPEPEAQYPRLSIFRDGEPAYQIHFESDPKRRLTLKVENLSPDLSEIRSVLEKYLSNGGMGLALVNTVQRAQDLYLLFPEGEPLEYEGGRVGKRLPDDTEIFLFHARFPADIRQKREDRVLEIFGESGPRTGIKILIATQVAEQSLDLDFDVIATDLAPIDLVLQRAGRLWRHSRKSRNVAEPILLVAGLAADEPPAFGEPLWWGAVYREDILLRTWTLLRERNQLTLPDEIDLLVRAVYEEEISLPLFIKERLEKALINGEGKSFALTAQAHQAIIGLPDDASWNDPARFVLYDEDEPEVHRSLAAQTRLGEDSVLVIPLLSNEDVDPSAESDFPQTKKWFLKAISVSRKSIVNVLRKQGVPEGWKKSSLLRNVYPLKLDERSCWCDDETVRLDEDLGLVYERKEP